MRTSANAARISEFLNRPRTYGRTSVFWTGDVPQSPCTKSVAQFQYRTGSG